MKRFALKLALFLLLGAILNVAVVWVISICQGSDNAIYNRYTGRYVFYSILRSQDRAATAAELARMEGLGWRKRPDNECFRFHVMASDQEAFGFQQRSFIEWPEFTCSGSYFVDDVPLIILRVGWPLNSLTDVVTELHTNGSIAVSRWTHRYAIDLGEHANRERWNSSGTLDRYTAPIMPLWPGFAINTIFYAAILWLVFVPFSFRRWRRRRRIKRGLCPACAYPVGTNPKCTECGMPVKAKMV